MKQSLEIREESKVVHNLCGGRLSWEALSVMSVKAKAPVLAVVVEQEQRQHQLCS